MESCRLSIWDRPLPPLQSLNGFSAVPGQAEWPLIACQQKGWPQSGYPRPAPVRAPLKRKPALPPGYELLIIAP